MEAIHICFTHIPGSGWTYALYTDNRGELTRSLPEKGDIKKLMRSAEYHRQQFIDADSGIHFAVPGAIPPEQLKLL